MHRRSLLAALPALSFAAPALAQSNRPIKLIVPVAPGGSQDIVARLFAQHLGPVLAQNIVVENHPGAGSNIGYALGARARPDGLTLVAGSDSLSINRSLFRNMGFDPVEDFAPVAQATSVPQILVVRADSPIRDLAGFVAASRAEPLAVGTPGNGSLSHLLLEVLQQASETRVIHAPYRGGALALVDLMGGSLQGVMINIGAITDRVRAGQLRGIAVSTARRAAALPDVPSFAEAGFSGVAVAGWHGLVAPRGTDPAVVARLHGALVQVLAAPEVTQRLHALGIEPVTEPPEALGARLRTDAARWEAVIRRTGMQPD